MYSLIFRMLGDRNFANFFTGQGREDSCGIREAISGLVT
jgi:hypothetical protein